MTVAPTEPRNTAWDQTFRNLVPLEKQAEVQEIEVNIQFDFWHVLAPIAAVGAIVGAFVGVLAFRFLGH